MVIVFAWFGEIKQQQKSNTILVEASRASRTSATANSEQVILIQSSLDLWYKKGATGYEIRHLL